MSFPEKKPIWMSKWAPPEVLLADFPLIVRRLGFKMVPSLDGVIMNWDDNCLRGTFGVQQTRWNFSKDSNKWTPTCSCGAPNNRCAHTVGLVIAFHKLCMERSWEMPKSVAPPPRAVSVTTKSTPNAAQKETLSNLANHNHVNTIKPKKDVANGIHSFRVEVDFRDTPKMATLQFYRIKENGDKYLLTLGEVINIGMALRLNKDMYCEWNEDVRPLFIWLSSIFSGKKVLAKHLTIFRLTVTDFLAWNDFWVEHSSFMLEKHTQMEVFRNKQFATLHFELEPAPEDRVRITPLITLPNVEEKIPFHEVVNRFAEGMKLVKINGITYDFDLPVSASLLKDCFAKYAPTIPADKIESHLGALLENRLDLVHGSIIEHSKNIPKLKLKLDFSEGDILVNVFLGKQCLVVKNGKLISTSSIVRLPNGKFMIESFLNKTLQDKLNKFLGAFIFSTNNVIISNTQVFLTMRKELLDLPAEIEKELDENLSDLLSDKDPQMVPVLTVRQEGNYYSIKLRWRINGEDFSDESLQQLTMDEEGELFAQSSKGGWRKVDNEFYSKNREWWQHEGFSIDKENRLLPEELKDLLAKQGTENELSVETVEATNEATKQAFVLDQESLDLVRQMLAAPAKEPLQIPETLEPILRPYQKEGFRFLAERYISSVGAILADDMGLGKTLQTLSVVMAVLAQKKQDELHGEKVIIICPASVQSVWLQEVKKFAPHIRVAAYAGNAASRKKIFKNKNWDCLLATYGIARSDITTIATHQFALAIIDEAQAIKNPEAKITVAIGKLKADCRLALTGTPLENQLLDVWSIMNFLNPGYLGTKQEFINGEYNQGDISSLRKRISPLMLRRTKKNVAKELPSRTEEEILIDMSDGQRTLYSQVQAAAREYLTSGQANRPGETVHMLTALTRLRQICCHPGLVGHPEINSTKVERLLEMISELINEGHSVLIFSQYVKMLNLVKDALPKNANPFMLTGGTSLTERANLVEEFNKEETPPSVFLISLKAGGVGLTLTKADYVFILDPWWNPAIERQAIDRTHRIGQDKPVIAYRFVMKNSVEEEVMKMKEEKLRLFDMMVDSDEMGDIGGMKITAEELKKLLLS